MRCGAAHIEVADGSAVTGPACYRAQEEQLFERKFALENVAFCQANAALDIERRLDLAADDYVFYVWGVFGNCVYYRVAEGFFLIVPIEAGF